MSGPRERVSLATIMSATGLVLTIAIAWITFIREDARDMDAIKTRLCQLEMVLFKKCERL